ncbi:MAG: hypothetical protein L6Q95_06875 [Planctomycetes bacterium]|nr:hypothetical protein [Planctomycetota bacterium]
MQVLAISNEASSKVQSFIADEGITYTVGVSTDALAAYGGGGIPHAYLIGADGVVAWHGHPASLPQEELERLLRHTFTLREVAPELKAAAAAFEKGKLAEAKTLAEAAKAKGGVDEDADYVIGRVADIVAGWSQTAEKGEPLDKLEALALVQKHYPGTEEAKAAAAREKELKADPAVQKEIAAWNKLEKIRGEIRRAEGDPKKLKLIRRKLEKLIESDGTTRAAKAAQQLLK